MSKWVLEWVGKRRNQKPLHVHLRINKKDFGGKFCPFFRLRSPFDCVSSKSCVFGFAVIDLTEIKLMVAKAQKQTQFG